jgi:predicted phage baseplate assembly protein
MIPLTEPLDTIAFDSLVELARSHLPISAPDWTDYNLSDPGITLVELLAWIADSQIYSIARDRRDERFAMAALLGIAAAGARAAWGTVLPLGQVPAGQVVPAGTKLVPAGMPAPRIEVVHDVALHDVRLSAIVSEGPDGPIDRLAANEQARASYAPFGAPPTRSSALRVELKGVLGAGPVSLSLGFELDDDDSTGRGALGEIRIVVVDGEGAETEVTATYDSTLGLRRSGVMILALPPEAAAGEPLRLRFRSTRAALMPRLVRIAPNALPVLQRATLRPDTFDGTGRAGQTIAIEPSSCFGTDEAAAGHIWRIISAGEDPAVSLRAGAGNSTKGKGSRTTRSQDFDETADGLAVSGSPLALRVRVQDGARLVEWKRGELSAASKEDRVYEVEERGDGTRISIRFGNGINGRRPGLGDQIQVKALISAGKSGAIASGVEWVLDGFGTRWSNPEAIEGGEDANDLDTLLGRLRSRIGSERPLATSEQIEAAAKALPRAFGIDRAAVIEAWEPGRRHPAWPATRTLLVTRKGAEGGSASAVETEDWRREIARQLRPRIALAERLIVATPVRRPLRVRVEAVAAPGRVPGTVAREIGDELALRLGSSGGRGEQWPIGRDVTTMIVGGWVRRLQGVAVLRSVVLLDERGDEIESGALRLARNELPAFVRMADDIRVAPEAAR